MRINHYIISEKQMYSTAVKMLLNDLKISGQVFQTVHDLKNSLLESKGTVVIVGPSEIQSPYKICQEISHLYPLTAVILLLKKEDIDYKEAMYAGAIDILDVECEEKEIIQSIKKAEEVVKLKVQGDSDQNNSEKSARIITVCSTKGGVGKTTISVNLAMAFNKKNLKVAVIDLDLQFGDVSLLFDKQPEQTIYDWVKQSYENGDKSIEKFLTKHHTGIDIMAAPSLPEFSELINGEHVEYLCEIMKQHYDIIVIDTPPAFVETSLVALENSDIILLIASLDLPALKNGKLAVDTLNLLGLKEHIQVILNRDSEEEGINKAMVEDVLTLPITGNIPSDYRTVISSVNRGEPFVTMAPRTPVAKAVMTIAEQLILGQHLENETMKKKKSLFIFKRKK